MKHSNSLVISRAVRVVYRWTRQLARSGDQISPGAAHHHPIHPFSNKTNTYVAVQLANKQVLAWHDNANSGVARRRMHAMHACRGRVRTPASIGCYLAGVWRHCRNKRDEIDHRSSMDPLVPDLRLGKR
jgi:hypothetical protein